MTANRVLVAEQLLERAESETGLSDWGDLPFREGLEVYLWSLEHEAGHPPERLAQLADGVVTTLAKRLRLVDDRKRHPEIAEEQITAPLVVLGLPRTGSTHLHALLATRPGVRAPLQWEMIEPSPPPRAETFDTDARIDKVQAQLDARPNAEELQAVHPFGARRPEQCIGLVDWSFLNIAALAPHRLPTYLEWVLAADHRAMYAHHRRTLQHLQWQVPGEWVLKWPKHVFGLEALLETYPDARIIWTHRDPGTVLPSVCNFVGTYRQMLSPWYDPVRFAREWTAMEETGLARAMLAREHLGDEARFFDLHYRDLVADPWGAVEGIAAHFDIPTDEDFRARVLAYEEENRQGKHGAHVYRAADYGLDPARLRARFGAYMDRFAVAPDPPRD